MMRDDLERLNEIPDPFLEAAGAPLQIENLGQVPSLTRVEVRMTRLVAPIVAILYDAAWPVFIERRPDLASAPVTRLVSSLAVPLAACVLAFTAVTGRTRSSSLGRSRGLTFGVVLAPPALFAIGTLVLTHGLRDDPSIHRLGACLAVTAALSAAPIALAVLAFRRAFASLAGWRSAALGVASGAIAAATMSIVCPIGGAEHVIVGHGSMMVLGGALAGAIGRRLCRA